MYLLKLRGFIERIFHFDPCSIVIAAQIGGNPGLQAIWEDEKQRRRNRNESSQITQPESQGISLIML